MSQDADQCSNLLNNTTTSLEVESPPIVDLVDGTRETDQTNRWTCCSFGSTRSCLSVFVQWRKWLRPVVVLLYMVILLVVLPLSIYDLQRKDVPIHKEAWFVGFVFAMLAIPISLWGIVQHMINYTQPQLQRHIIRIMWMVPIYSLNAWLALRFPDSAIYLDVARECYEAYVIYNFMCYLLNFLHSQYADPALMIDNKPRVSHLVPCCCLPKWPMGQVYIDRCRHGVLQYTIVRPAMTVTALLCEMTNVYDEGQFTFKNGWSYITLINNVSQIVAMYCLVMFYRATKEELAPIKPVPKFMCVKAVVFLSFWQSVLLAILANVGVLKGGTLEFTTKQVSAGIQDFLICIEMFLAAIAHYFSFSHRPFMDARGTQANCLSSFFSMWDISDVGEDFAEHISYVSHQVRSTMRPGRRKSNDETLEKIPLLPISNGGEYGCIQSSNDPAINGESQDTEWNCSLDVKSESPTIRTLSLNNYLEMSVSEDNIPSLLTSAASDAGASDGDGCGDSTGDDDDGGATR